MDDGLGLEVLSSFGVLSASPGSTPEDIGSAMPFNDHNGRLRSSFRGDGEIPTETLRQVREEMVAVAKDFGFPGKIKSVSEFDSAGAIVLRNNLDLTLNEAAQPGVWTYLTCCWMLDIAVWRWNSEGKKDVDDARFLGNPRRNTLRRMWWFAEMLYVPEEGLPSLEPIIFTQDDHQAVFERPGAVGTRRIARAIAEELEIARENFPGVKGEALMRDMMKRLSRISAVVLVASYDYDETRLLIRELLEISASALVADD